MKRFIFTILLVLGFGVLSAQNNNSIDFNTTLLDLGVVPEHGGLVKAEYILTNNTNGPIIINKVTASCGCTSPEWTKSPIEPGKTGVISVAYNPKNTSGEFAKSIFVYTSFQTSPYTLHIKGMVEIDKNNPASHFPYSWGDILSKKRNLDLGQNNSDITRVFTIEIYNNADIPLKAGFADVPAYLQLKTIPETIPPKTSASLEVQVKGTEVKEKGQITGTLRILPSGSNGYSSSHSISYHGTVIGPSSAASTGKINFGSMQLLFDPGKTKDEQVLKISNSGKGDLNILNIQSSDPQLSVSKKNLTIGPGKIKEVTVTLNRKSNEQPFYSTLIVISDDQMTPLQVIIAKTNSPKK